MDEEEGSEESEEETDPNLVRIEELKAKQESSGEFTEEEMEFLDQMAGDPNYPVDVEVDQVDE